MSEKITVLLADTVSLQREALRTLLAAEEDIQVVGEATTGRQVLTMAYALRPQVVITELWMPELDGLSLLRCFRQIDPLPKTILLTAFCADHIMAEAARRGAFYCMAKPVDVQSLFDQIRLAAEVPATVSPINATLQALCLRPHEQRFRYLAEALAQVLRDPDIINAMTKELYPAVAQAQGGTSKQVEITIRRAITYIWQTAEGVVLQTCLPALWDKPRPANKKFIDHLAQYLKKEHQM